MKATLDRPDAPDATDAPTEDAAAPPDAPRERARFRTAPGPWRRRDALLCGLLGVLGVAGIVACWVGATDEVAWRDQLGWTIGAVFSTGLVVLGGGLWVLIGLREVRRGFRDLRREQRVVLGLTRVPVATAVLEATAEAEYVRAPEMTRAHRPDCLLMRNKSAVPVPATDLERYPRCGVCSS